jgi:anti-sigma-K factor RskA
MTDEHRSAWEALGAYALGALDPDERRAIDAHLEECQRCRNELSRFAPLPTLLGRLSEEEASSGILSRELDVLPVLLREASDERHRLRRHLHAWRLAAAVIAVLAVVAWAPWETPPEAWEAPPVAVAPAAGTTDGAAALYAWEWGTTVEMRLLSLPPREEYVLWAIAEDGTRQQAGTWGPTSRGTAYVRGASSLSRPDIARVEVTDEAGDLVLTFTFTNSASP